MYRKKYHGPGLVNKYPRSFGMGLKPYNPQYIVDTKENDCKEVKEDEEMSLAILNAKIARHEKILEDEVQFLNRTNDLFVTHLGKLVAIQGIAILSITCFIALLLIIEAFK